MNISNPQTDVSGAKFQFNQIINRNSLEKTEKKNATKMEERKKPNVDFNYIVITSCVQFIFFSFWHKIIYSLELYLRRLTLVVWLYHIFGKY